MHFSLPSVPVQINLGVTTEERVTPQEILLTISWDTNTTLVEKSDNIAHTIDYFVLRQWIIKWGEGHSFATIEKCLAVFNQELKQEFPLINNLHTTLTKTPNGEFRIVAEL